MLLQSVLVSCLLQGLMASAIDSSEKHKLTVTSIVEAPYLTQEPDGSFSGLIPDLLHLLGQKMGEEFQIHLVKDGRYGAEAGDGTWSGMIGELIAHEADLAAAPLTVTNRRAHVVDFGLPIMEEQVTALIPMAQVSSKWRIGARPQHRHKTLRDMETRLNVKIQRCRETDGIVADTLQELVDDPSVRFSFLNGGSTSRKLKDSKNPAFNEVFQRAVRDNSTVATGREGFEGAAQNKHVFFGERHFLQYYASRECKVRVMRESISESYYALAFPKDSALRAQANEALNHLKLSGELSKLRNKYWPTKPQWGGCARERMTLRIFTSLWMMEHKRHHDGGHSDDHHDDAQDEPSDDEDNDGDHHEDHHEDNDDSDDDHEERYKRSHHASQSMKHHRSTCQVVATTSATTLLGVEKQLPVEFYSEH